MQRLQFERRKYADEQQRRMVLEIVANPLKAYDYGTEFSKVIKGKFLKKFGFKSFIMSFRIPHQSLFDVIYPKFENKSAEGITTEIRIKFPQNLEWMNLDKIKKIVNSSNIIETLESNVDGDSVYIYKKCASRTSVYRKGGFRRTLMYEDEFSHCIEDLYISFEPRTEGGILYCFIVKTYADKETSFEKLEGRRYYLMPLIERIISTASITDMKLAKVKNKK